MHNLAAINAVGTGPDVYCDRVHALHANKIAYVARIIKSIRRPTVIVNSSE